MTRRTQLGASGFRYDTRRYPAATVRLGIGPGTGKEQ